MNKKLKNLIKQCGGGFISLSFENGKFLAKTGYHSVENAEDDQPEEAVEKLLNRLNTYSKKDIKIDKKYGRKPGWRTCNHKTECYDPYPKYGRGGIRCTECGLEFEF